MRNAFSRAVIEKFSQPSCFFLTGDLGFMALEGIRDTLGDRFINCGVAEQNMISVAAGLASEGFQVFVYSIGPFCYARPFEQIRNDICFGRLPVCLVGNGGGYAYGSMGPTHHALEDCAAMSALGVKVLVPAFNQDIVPLLSNIDSPTYLRLGREELPIGYSAPEHLTWRCLLDGSAGLLVALGPLAGVCWQALDSLDPKDRPALWAVTALPLDNIPVEFLRAVASGKTLAVMEEHIAEGGLGMQLVYALSRRGIGIKGFLHRHALGYPSGRYGSQKFHRQECGLDEEGVAKLVRELVTKQ